MRWELLEQVRLRHQPLRPGVAHDELQTILWIGGIERHIGAARLQDPEDPSHQIEVPLKADPHHRLRTDAALAQRMRDLVGSRVQRSVRQLFRVADQRHPVGRPLRLCFHQRVHAVVARASNRRAAGQLKDRIALRVVQQRQPRDWLIRIGKGAAQQHLEMAQHPPDRGRLEEISAVVDLDSELLPVPDCTEFQIKAGDVRLNLLALHLQASELR